MGPNYGSLWNPLECHDNVVRRSLRGLRRFQNLALKLMHPKGWNFKFFPIFFLILELFECFASRHSEGATKSTLNGTLGTIFRRKGVSERPWWGSIFCNLLRIAEIVYQKGQIVHCCTQKKRLPLLVKLAKIRLYSPLFDWSPAISDPYVELNEISFGSKSIGKWWMYCNCYFSIDVVPNGNLVWF